MMKYINAVMQEFLTERQRRVFILYYGKKMNSAEIAKKIGISPQAVGRIASRTMKVMQKHKKIFLETKPK